LTVIRVLKNKRMLYCISDFLKTRNHAVQNMCANIVLLYVSAHGTSDGNTHYWLGKGKVVPVPY
jgi:hypothetical protein